MARRRLFILLLFVASASAKEEVAPPNFVIFIADDVSWDDFGCTGNLDVQTPRIDALAAEGIQFNQVYLTTSSCSPTRNSIMAGRYPHNTGAAELHTQPPFEMLSFPELLREAGYYSGHSGKFHMGKNSERGFDVIYRSKEDIGDGGEASWVKMLRERPREQPFFFWMAALDGHRPWGPNEFSGTHDPDTLEVPHYLADEPGTRRDLAQYYDEVFRFDHHIGQALDELEAQGALDNTVVLVMSDNGRPFPHSKTRLTDRGVKTPFILRWPECVSEPATSEALVSVIDIAPTVLELAGIAPKDSFQGHSFASVIRNPEKSFRNHVFAEHNWHDYEAHERMARKGPYLYIRNARPELPQLGPADSIGSPSHADLVERRKAGRLSAIQADLFRSPRPFEELYDCVADPEQLVNLASVPEYQNVLGELRHAMDLWMEQTADTVPSQLTKDWYLPVPGYERTEHHGVRGIMPGEAGVATETTAKGPY